MSEAIRRDRTGDRLPTRREFLHASGASLLAVGVAHARIDAQRVEPFDVSEKSIRELQAAMADGRVTAEKLVERYVERMATTTSAARG
jgi:hypothetical protein